jgi:hypothetical protein
MASADAALHRKQRLGVWSEKTGRDALFRRSRTQLRYPFCAPKERQPLSSRGRARQCAALADGDFLDARFAAPPECEEGY